MVEIHQILRDPKHFTDVIDNWPMILGNFIIKN